MLSMSGVVVYGQELAAHVFVHDGVGTQDAQLCRCLATAFNCSALHCSILLEASPYLFDAECIVSPISPSPAAGPNPSCLSDICGKAQVPPCLEQVEQDQL